MAGLIAVDLDGTLLDGRGRVSEANRRAVDRLRAAGWTLVPATGRSWREARRTLQAIDHDGIAVTAGGSVLSDARSGETIDRMTLDARGGGGTDFAPAFDRVRELIDDGENIAGMIYLTDLDGSFPDEPADYPVLWAAYNTTESAPFGRTIHVKK